MNLIENIIFVAILVPVFIAFIMIGRYYILKSEKKYWDDVEREFLHKKKE